MSAVVVHAAGTALELRRVVPGSPDRVFAAWTDPAWIARWMTPVGTATAEVDLRVGGRFRIVMAGDGQVIEHTGEYLEVDPPRRLRFTWRSPYTGSAPSEVTVTFDPVGDGTEMRLIHAHLPPGAASSHAGGWDRMVDGLAAELARAAEEDT